MEYNNFYYKLKLLFFRLIKEQEKNERQEAVRREREIRNQQLLEVSNCQFRVSFF